MGFFRGLLSALFVLMLGSGWIAPLRIGAQAASHGSAAPAALLDLNTATREQLRALPGSGSVYADRIIKGRPYTAKTQLTQRGIISEAAYAKMKDRVVARRR